MYIGIGESFALRAVRRGAADNERKSGRKTGEVVIRDIDSAARLGVQLRIAFTRARLVAVSVVSRLAWRSIQLDNAEGA